MDSPRHPLDRSDQARNAREVSSSVSVGQQAIVECLLSTFREPQYRPPRLPTVAIELLELTRRPAIPIDRIVRLLENDQLLAAEVLRLAQSAVYSSGRRVYSLTDAVVRLGIRGTSDLLLEAAMKLRVFRCREYQPQMDLLRRHSSATAVAARLIARETSVCDEHSFTCALLHDVGIAAALIAFSENGAPPYDFLRPAIERAHEECGAVLCRLWKLPEEVVFVVGHHHHCVIDGNPHPTAITVCLAEEMVTSLGYGFEQEPRVSALGTAAALFGLDQPRLERLRNRLIAELNLCS
jgi:putative nucleotidyltransferase with HDIG domain